MMALGFAGRRNRQVVLFRFLRDAVTERSGCGTHSSLFFHEESEFLSTGTFGLRNTQPFFLAISGFQCFMDCSGIR